MVLKMGFWSTELHLVRQFFWDDFIYRITLKTLLFNSLFLGRRPKNNKKNQKADISPQGTSADLDTSKLATESSEHEVYIYLKE